MSGTGTGIIWRGLILSWIGTCGENFLKKRSFFTKINRQEGSVGSNGDICYRISIGKLLEVWMILH